MKDPFCFRSEKLAKNATSLWPSSVILLTPLLLAGCDPSGQATTDRTSTPNIIVILADDMGYGDVSAYNEEAAFETPFIDRLAQEGLLFDAAYSTSAVCTPTRYSLLTGRYNWRSELKNSVLGGYSAPLIAADRLTVAGMLQEQGYHTAFVGKWHLGWDWVFNEPPGNLNALHLVHDVDYTQPISNGPESRGFDYSYGFSGSLDMAPYVYVEDGMPTAVPTETTVNYDSKGFWRQGPTAPDFRHVDVLPHLTDVSVDYINRQARTGSPFFLYFSLPSPHTPILPTTEYMGISNSNMYGDFVVQTDGVVGTIMQALEENEIAGQTLIIFSADNGASPLADYPELARAGHNPSYIFRGHKADIFEGGLRVPTALRWPDGVVAPGRLVEQTVSQVDLMATFAEITGATYGDNVAEDSYSFLPLLRNEPYDSSLREGVVLHSIAGRFALIQDHFKLILWPGSGGWSPPRTPEELEGLPAFQLYDLRNDPGETTNLIDRYPERAASMQALLEQYITQGRSTPGRPQANDGPQWWPQLHFMSEPDTPEMQQLPLEDLSEIVVDHDNWVVAGGAELDPDEPRRLLALPGTGVLVNSTDTPPLAHMFSRFDHGDLELEVEFMVAEGSNSGIYFQGRYEVQILDSWQVAEPSAHDLGAIYMQHHYRPDEPDMFPGSAPKVNMARAPGEWQKFHIVFRAPRFDSDGKKTANARFESVYLNGERIQHQVEVQGPTASPAFEDEAALGPLKIQGTHGPVAIRNLRYRHL